MTHINAYYMAVDEAKAEVVQSKAKLQAAEDALKAHPDYVAPKKETPNPKKSDDSEPVKVTVKKSKK